MSDDKTEVDMSEVDEPEVDESDVDEPEVNEPDVDKPEVEESENIVESTFHIDSQPNLDDGIEEIQESINKEEQISVESNTSDVIVQSSESTKCISLMHEVYNGEYLMLPEFAQSLVTFLHEDTPESDNPRVLANHIAMKGMYVMKKAVQLGNNNTEEIVQGPSVLRDFIAILCGTIASSQYRQCAILLLAYLVRTSLEYMRLSKQNKQIIDFSFIVCSSYIWCNF
jgi:hypothetical protein